MTKMRIVSRYEDRPPLPQSVPGQVEYVRVQQDVGTYEPVWRSVDLALHADGTVTWVMSHEPGRVIRPVEDVVTGSSIHVHNAGEPCNSRCIV